MNPQLAILARKALAEFHAGLAPFRKSLPNVSDVHIDAALTNISVAFFQEAAGFCFNKVFPVVPVEKQTDKYFVWDRADAYRGYAKKRAPGTEAGRIGMRLSNDSYSADEYALDMPIPDQVRANQDAAVNLESHASESLMQALMIGAEQVWVDNFFATGKWGTDVTGAVDFTQWSNYAASDPAAQISTGRLTIKQNTGYSPNTLVVAEHVHEVLKRHPLILDRTKYTSAESITAQVLARYFEVDNYMVAGAVKTTSAEGAASATFDFVAGKHALLCYTTPRPGLMVPTAGYTFGWRGLTGMNDNGIKVKRYRDEKIASDIVEDTLAYDQKIVTSAMGYFMASAVA